MRIMQGGIDGIAAHTCSQIVHCNKRTDAATQRLFFRQGDKDGPCFLKGRVIQQRIAEHGSVSAAAKSMEMSFSHAWHLVESMNTLAPEPLVAKQAGGGGGARLTEAGHRAVADFLQLVQRFQGWIGQEGL